MSWSDEFVVQIIFNLYRGVQNRYDRGCPQPSVKHDGGSVIVQGCISAGGGGAQKCNQILNKNPTASGKDLICNRLFFCMATIPNRLPMQPKETLIEKQWNFITHGLSSTESGAQHY